MRSATLRRLALLAAALSAPTAMLSLTPTPASAFSHPAPLRLSVLAWNVDLLPGLVDTVKGLRAAERTPRIEAVLRSQAADVVVLDELFNNDSIRTLESDLADLYPYHTPVVGQSCSTRAGWGSVSGNCSSSPFIFNGGTLILSRLPITQTHELVYNDSVSWDWWTNKGAALAQIDDNGTQVWVAGTHLQADQAGTSIDTTRQVRLNQLTQLKNWADAKAATGLPVLLAGDLNVEYYAGSVGRTSGDSDYDRAQQAAGAVLRTSAQGSEPVTTIDCRVSAWCQQMAGVESFPSDYHDDVDYLGYLNYTAPDGTTRPTPLWAPYVSSIPSSNLSPGVLDTEAPSDHYPAEATYQLALCATCW